MRGFNGFEHGPVGVWHKALCSGALLAKTTMQPPTPPDAAKEIELVKSMVAKHFPVYDVKVSYDVVQFFCRVDETMLEEHFDQMRQEMSSKGYVPMMTYEGGEHVVIVARKPPARHRSVYVNLALFIVTFLTVTLVGLGYWGAYADTPSDEYFSGENILGGILSFTLPLMAILGVHEMSHYFAARRRNVAASLPFFIPMPFMLGTFGAFISLREPVPNRKTMIEIGAAGPIGGLLMTIPLAIIGLMLTDSGAKPIPEDVGSGGLMTLQFPLLYLWMNEFVPSHGDYLLHPTAFAAWVGFFLTAINLLPAGQLDGGHIAQALFGRNSRYVGWAAIIALIGLALVFGWWGWMLFAVLIIFLGVNHPPPLNDITKLCPKRKMLGVLMFGILALTFVPVPLQAVLPDYSFEASAVEGTDQTILPGESKLLTLFIENVGNVRNNVTIECTDSPSGWLVAFGHPDDALVNYTEQYAVLVGLEENVTVGMRVMASVDAVPETNYSLSVQALSSEDDVERTIDYVFAVGVPIFSFSLSDDVLVIPVGSSNLTTVEVLNSEDVEAVLSLKISDFPTHFNPLLYEDDPYLDENDRTLEISVPAEGSATFGVIVHTFSMVSPGEYAIEVEARYFGALIGTIVIAVEVV